ncbi:MAG: hypothetical protein Q9174_005293 [Haloplaca sp. 1 TL-2023]
MAPHQTTISAVSSSCTHREVQHETSKAFNPSPEAHISPPAIPSSFAAEEMLTIDKLGTNSSFTWDEIAEIIVEVRRERIMQNLERGDVSNTLHLPSHPFTGAQVQEVFRKNREVFDSVYRKEILPLRIPYNEDQYFDGASRIMRRYLDLRAKDPTTRYLVEKLWGDYSRLAQEVNAERAANSKKRKAEEPAERVMRGKKRWLGGTWHSREEAIVISDSDDD